ncbi:epithelial cell-transforming sequence 2 oncogene-like isoform X2 [Acanthaster planci]|nr:epithelial cell-transforming sequence 2 oncogene-like isoform X2 [Acanthaster planci]XP_022108402.1 epithelial cell-transforming sequence 2 oncogene-like isoform X2 [Acanthaster planci]XP_022108409.1 epithelial cell-transforming sequence 2 oncogene-like isoform X2 [Acanthaster planci]XP_022108418.1 epithelial cell-transforming sequence 2 oncogene-like isoform X2 [Acanthaster planci]
MAAKARESRTNGTPSNRIGLAPLASLREPVYPTERAAKSAKKTAMVAPLASEGNFQTLKMKTNQSQWTPILHKPSNEQIFVERRELIGHWFDLWTDAQRKRFLQYILLRCRRAQLLYLYNWFQGRVPLEHLDFTAVLPRFLALYILSYLDPRSLSKAAMVCWHWKFLAEQDILWMPKCIKLGWFLPYKPKDNEYGAWKRHYVHCLQTLDVAQSPKDFGLYGRMGDGSTLDDSEAKKKKKQRSSDVLVSSSLDSRPVWLDPDPRPQDLENAYQSMVHSGNPNQPGMPPSTWKHANSKTVNALPVRKHGRSWTEPAREFDYGLGAKSRREQHRAQGRDDLDFSGVSTEAVTLSASIALEMGQPVGAALLQSIRHEAKKPVTRRRDLSAGGDYPGGIATRSHSALGKLSPAGPRQNPRLLVISSQITAMQLLISAVKPDVLVVAYEYIGTTLESLLFKIEEVLAGMQARSIGIMVEGCDEIQLVGSMATSRASLERPELKYFWEQLCANILPGAQGGHLDLFVPLAACDDGCILLQQLNQLTGIPFTSPSTLSDSKYGHVMGEWDNWGKSPSPASLYLEYDKLQGWLVSAQRVMEAVAACQKHLRSYLRGEKEDLVAKLAGDVVFSNLGTQDARLGQIAPSLVQALSNLTEQSLEVDPLTFVGKQLIQASGQDQKMTAAKQSPAKGLAAVSTKPLKKMSSLDVDGDSEISEEIGEEISDFDSEVENINHKALYSSVSELRPAEVPVTTGPQQASTFKVTQLQTGDPRHSTAVQILSSELAYLKHLNIIEDVYRKPLLAAIKSNKAIISQANVQMIFTDVNLILSITRELVEDMSDHLEQWSPEQCIGDCFIKLQAKLKTYTNFHKNYQIVLSTLDKCRQQYPAFRAFLKRTDCSPQTGMMSLTDLFLRPARRVCEYIQMLLAQQGVTADEHPDNTDLGVAVGMFRQLQAFVDECRERSERERQLQELQRRIKKCPALLEANRFLIREQVVANMQQIEESGKATGLYEHISDLGLFLFNDALMVTIRTIKTLPYTRQTEALYHFHSSVALPRLLVQELPDSKYIQHVFVLQTPKRRWVCSAEDENDKITLVSAIETAVRASLDET